MINLEQTIMPTQTINPSLLTIKLAQSEDEKIKFAKLALKNRLYVSGWCLSKELINLCVSDNSLDYDVCMAFYGGFSVGISIIRKYEWPIPNSIMFFVKKSFRKNGIATNMLELMKTKKLKIKANYNCSVDGIKFFEKVGL